MITGITVGGARRNMSAVPVSPVQPAPVRNGRRRSSVGRRVRTSYDGGMLVSAGMDKQGEGEGNIWEGRGWDAVTSRLISFGGVL